MKQIVLSFITALGFSVLFNIERKKAVIASLGGALSWAGYLLAFHYTQSDLASLFFGSLTMGLYSEILARLLKSPATIFYIPGFIPLVPGAAVYSSAYEFVNGETSVGMNYLVQALVKSGAITLGLIFSAAIVLMVKNFRKSNLKKAFRPEVIEIRIRRRRRNEKN